MGPGTETGTEAAAAVDTTFTGTATGGGCWACGGVVDEVVDTIVVVVVVVVDSCGPGTAETGSG